MKYGYRTNGPRPSVPVEVTAGELERIRQRDGSIGPAAVVEEARPDDAPLHGEFEWDDAAAASAYREDQARRIIRSVVILGDEAPQPLQVRAYISVHTPTDESLHARSYVAVNDALSDPEAASRLKQRFLREIVALRARYHDLLQYESDLLATFDDLIRAAS